MRYLQLTSLLLAAVLSGLACDGPSAPTTPAAPTTMAACLPCGGHQLAVTDKTPRCEHDGVTYYFCSDACRDAFLKDPAKYLPRPATQPDK
jgi:YHS domain-containing protein